MKTNIFLKKIKRIFKDESKDREIVHDYWKAPNDGTNQPEEYVKGVQKSEYLLSKIQKLGTEMEVLEIGCNVGRNLNYLHKNNFNNLSGVEISENALSNFKSFFEDTYSTARLYNTSIEAFFTENPNIKFDLIYTMAVLEHIHSDSDWIFERMVRQTNKYILVIEDEKSISWKHFPRNYKKIFQNLGMKQVEFENCSNIKSFNDGFMYRLFEKEL